ncbi:catalase [Streptomyces decoyicus]|uniref:catalase n=1 Tax=Streptomyces decoyicus TaxID=249567 RepID=UPI0004AA5E35|nr:hypothetical protein ADK74_18775 [Streptomyces decoyicus]
MTVQETGPLTTESGALVADHQNSEQAGVSSPAPVQDQVLLEQLAHLTRERVGPARDTGAWADTAPTPRGRLRDARSGMPYFPSSHVIRA